MIILQDSNHRMPSNQLPQQMQTYQVSEVPNYANYHACCGFMLSEPMKYLGTHLLVWLIMALYYVVCAWRTPLGLLIATVVVNAGFQIALTVLGLRDPGIIPKILREFEK